jgi:hypothetical protein
MLIRITSLLARIGVAGAVISLLGLTFVPPAVAQSGVVSITTDRSQYQPGDSIRVCYTVAGPGPFTITDTQADGSIHTFFSGVDDGTGGCLTGTVTPPMGTECLRISASGGFGGSSQTCFQVGGGIVPPPPPIPPPGPCPQIYPPPPGCGGSGGTITTDQSQYTIGSPIRICYTVPGPGPVTVTDSQNGTSHVLLSTFDDGSGWCFGGTITPPTGTECERLDYSGGTAQTCFQVVGSGTYGCGFGSQTSGFGNNNGSVTLHTGQCLLLALDSNYNWSVTVNNPAVLSCDSQLGSGEEASCTAVGLGSTTLQATGNPLCYPQCLLPSRLFQLSVTVVP